MGIGANVKKFRMKLGVDQKTLAKMLGVTTGAVSNYENDVSSPREEVLYRMFEVFEVSPNELFEGCYYIDSKKNSPVSEDTEDDEISVEDMREFLSRLGFIAEGRDLSEKDIVFMRGVFDLLGVWFGQ